MYVTYSDDASSRVIKEDTEDGSEVAKEGAMLQWRRRKADKEESLDRVYVVKHQSI